MKKIGKPFLLFFLLICSGKILDAFFHTLNKNTLLQLILQVFTSVLFLLLLLLWAIQIICNTFLELFWPAKLWTVKWKEILKEQNLLMWQITDLLLECHVFLNAPLAQHSSLHQDTFHRIFFIVNGLSFAWCLNVFFTS